MYAYAYRETIYNSNVCQSKIWKQPGCPLIQECVDMGGLSISWSGMQLWEYVGSVYANLDADEVIS